jgi:hypothetical protein
MDRVWISVLLLMVLPSSATALSTNTQVTPANVESLREHSIITCSSIGRNKIRVQLSITFQQLHPSLGRKCDLCLWKEPVKTWTLTPERIPLSSGIVMERDLHQSSGKPTLISRSDVPEKRQGSTLVYTVELERRQVKTATLWFVFGGGDAFDVYEYLLEPFVEKAQCLTTR